MYVCIHTHTHTHTHTHPIGSLENTDSFTWGFQPAFIAGAWSHHTMSPICASSPSAISRIPAPGQGPSPSLGPSHTPHWSPCL